MNDSLWTQLLNKINGLKKSWPTDRYVHLYRQGLLREFDPRHHNTVDTYVKMICVAGYLRKIERGHYVILEKIPLDVSMSKFKKNYYGNMMWTEQVITFPNMYNRD